MRSKPGPVLRYHRSVSYQRDAMDSFFLDWAAQPRVQKSYPGYPREEFKERLEFPPRSFQAVLEPVGAASEPPELSRERLSRILFSAYGATAASRQPGGEFRFRTAPSAGALYPAELYLVLAEGQAGESDLEPGLYHYGSPDHRLTLLRPGLFGFSESLFLLTAITFRSAWKYRARALRYCCLDTGHAAENLLLALGAEGFRPALDQDAVEPVIGRFLGIDPDREWPLVAVGLNGPPGPWPDLPDHGDDPDLASPSRVSEGEKGYPNLKRIRAALAEPKDQSQGPAEPAVLGEKADLGLIPGPWQPRSDPGGPLPEPDLGQSLLTRRSKRNFIKAPLDGPRFNLLAGMMRTGTDLPFKVGLLCGGVEGLADGFHLLDKEAGRTALVKAGDLRTRMAGACLDQAWLGQAALHFLFLADLAGLDRAGGPRAYKEALVLAGRLGQRVYLGAAGTGLGCCGVGAFYDQECRELLGLSHQAGLLYLVAAGPVKK